VIAGRTRSGWAGCALWALAFAFVIAGGCAIGLVLRPDPDGPATVARGQGWEIEVVEDEAGDPCVNLVIGNQIRTGQCGFAARDEEDRTVYRATSAPVGGNVILVFGPVPEGVARVRLRLDDGSRPTVGVEERKSVRYFVFEGKVEDRGPTTLLDAEGNEVELPA